MMALRIGARRAASGAEQGLVARARTGDTEAFDRLFTQHKDSIYSCLRFLLAGDAEEVEEAVGNVFVRAYRNLGRFRGDSSFSTWLYRIAINEGKLRIRSKRRKILRDIPLREEVAADSARAGSDPALQVVQDDDARRLWQAVLALPEPYRSTVVLRYVSGLPTPDIAQVLKRPAGTVRYQLGRAMRILRERLGDDWQR